MCIYNKGCGFNTSHTTDFHDTCAAHVPNNQPFAFPIAYLFPKTIAAASGTVPQVASNNGEGTQAPPPINDVTDPSPFSGLHHIGAADNVVSTYEHTNTKIVT